MTQRKIERISGWIAASCWFVAFALGLLSVLSHEPNPTPTTAVTSSAPVTKAHSAKHTPKAAQAAALSTPPRYESSLQEQMLMLLGGLVSMLAWAVTWAWNWRRKQRIRAEIRAEAWGRQSLESRRRDGRAVGV